MNYKLFLLLPFVFIITACGPDRDRAPREPGKDSYFILDIPEPSGLAFSKEKDALYTVSDNTGKVYKISFNGKTLEELPFVGIDLEGIAIDELYGEIYVVEEGLQRVNHLTKDGVLIDAISSVHINTIASSGFEGIAKNGDYLYILVEKEPGTLIKYHIPSKTWTQKQLSFAFDYSGIDYDTSDNSLWIISDESKKVYHCDLEGKVMADQSIDVEQGEGIVVDRLNKIIWIVSDTGNKLYKINLKI